MGDGEKTPLMSSSEYNAPSPLFASFHWLTTNLLRAHPLRLLKGYRHKGLWLDLICIAFLALAATKVLWGFNEVIDLSLSDETSYLSNGVTLLEEGFPSPQWAPLYSVWHFLLSFFAPNNQWLYYFNYIALATLTPVFLYIALRRLEVGLMISFLISGLYLLSFLNLAVQPFVTKFAAFVLLLFLIATTFCTDKGWRYVIWIMCTLVLGFIRPELFVSFILLVAAVLPLALFGILRRNIVLNRSMWAKCAVIAGVTVTFIWVLGWPIGGSRSAIAFNQHFAKNYAEWNELDLRSGQGVRSSITRQVFGDFETVPQAARQNREAFLRHMYTNLHNYPENLKRALIIEIPGRVISRQALTNLNNTLFAGLIVVALVSVGANIVYRRVILGSGWFPPIRWKSIPLVGQDDRFSYTYLIQLLALLSVPTLLSSIIIYPKLYYLHLQILILLIVFGVLVSKTAIIFLANTLSRRMEIITLCGLLIVFVILVPNLAFGWSWSPPSDANKVWTPRKNTILLINSLGIRRETTFLSSIIGSQANHQVYLGDNFIEAPRVPKTEEFAKFVAERGIDMVIWPELYEKRIQSLDGTGYAEFLKDPNSHGFHKVPVPGICGRSILLRHGLEGTAQIISSSQTVRPGQVPGLKIWLDAAAVIGLDDGDLVDTWSDQSGNGNHVSQISVDHQPRYLTNTQNSLPVVRFDGVNDYLGREGFEFSALTLFIAVSRVSVDDTRQYLVGEWSPSNDARRWVVHVTPTNNYRVTADSDGRQGGGVFVRESATADRAIITYTHDGSRMAFRKNSEDVCPDGDSRLYTGGTVDLGIGGHPLGRQSFDGDIGEILLYDRALTNDEILAVETHLRSKWDISR
jgi:hypothetical protein